MSNGQQLVCRFGISGSTFPEFAIATDGKGVSREEATVVTVRRTFSAVVGWRPRVTRAGRPLLRAPRGCASRVRNYQTLEEGHLQMLDEVLGIVGGPIGHELLN
jgi:hypothetical protein